jgi:hypothetical protein
MNSRKIKRKTQITIQYTEWNINPTKEVVQMIQKSQTEKQNKSHQNKITT